MSSEEKRIPGKDVRPADPFGHMMKAMNDFFIERNGQRGILEHIDEFFGNPRRMGSFTVELEENEDEYVVKALLPGIKKEQIDIEVLDNQLAIHVSHAERLELENKETKTYSRSEKAKRMSRLIPFYKPVSVKAIKASYDNGLLKIIVPKKRGKRINF